MTPTKKNFYTLLVPHLLADPRANHGLQDVEDVEKEVVHSVLHVPIDEIHRRHHRLQAVFVTKAALAPDLGVDVKESVQVGDRESPS